MTHDKATKNDRAEIMQRLNWGTEQDARLIIQAVNSHEKLTEALQALANEFEGYMVTDTKKPPDRSWRALESARAALSLAEETT